MLLNDFIKEIAWKISLKWGSRVFGLKNLIEGPGERVSIYSQIPKHQRKKRKS